MRTSNGPIRARALRSCDGPGSRDGLNPAVPKMICDQLAWALLHRTSERVLGDALLEHGAKTGAPSIAERIVQRVIQPQRVIQRQAGAEVSQRRRRKAS